MRLNAEELERYARHIVLAEIGGAGQQKLKAARVLVIGAGGLGAPLIQYLAAAGVGTLGIADDDTVSLSNLQRQIIHDSANLGQAKTASARRAVMRINPHVRVIVHEERLGPANADRIVRDYAIVADGCDNAETRYLVADACERAQIALVSAAVGRFDGNLTVLKPHERGPDGQWLPRYRDIFPRRAPAGLVPDCAQAGIIGALPGVIGSMQALEVIKEIAGIGESLAGRLILYDGLAGRFETIRCRRGGDGDG